MHMYEIKISFWTIEKECRAAIGSGTWCGSATSLDSAVKLASCHTLAMFNMKYDKIPTVWTEVVNAVSIPAKQNICALCLGRNSCKSHSVYISGCNDYIQGAQINVEMYKQEVDATEVDATEVVDLGVSDENNNICSECLSKNTCSILKDLRKRGISLENAHISECNQFMTAQTIGLMRCKYCGTLQDEPQGAKICVQCGGAI